MSIRSADGRVPTMLARVRTKPTPEKHILPPLDSTAFPYARAHSKLTLQWRHNERDGVSNHQPRDCLLNRLFGRRSKETSKLRVTGLCAGNSPVSGEFPAQRTSNAENVIFWWRHHEQQMGMYLNVLYIKWCDISLPDWTLIMLPSPFPLCPCEVCNKI